MSSEFLSGTDHISLESKLLFRIEKKTRLRNSGPIARSSFAPTLLSKRVYDIRVIDLIETSSNNRISYSIYKYVPL